MDKIESSPEIWLQQAIKFLLNSANPKVILTGRDWWKKKTWAQFTGLEKNKQGPALVMTLHRKALDSILEISD